MYAFYKKYEYFFIALFILISQLAVFPELGNRYPDTDNYTHARRVLDLILSKDWAEMPYMHTNYPFGEILHFTRITDLFWLLFSAPAFLFFPLKEAVFWGGYIFQTALLILSALTLIWALKPVGGPILRLIGVCLFFVQPAVTETYILIKPDHHALTAFFCFATTGGLIRFLDEEKEKYLVFAGISAGLCLWSSIEGILITYALLASLILLFLMNKTKAKTAAVYFFCYFASAFVFLMINPPFEGFFYPDNGRLSFLLVALIGLTTAAMMLLALLEAKGKVNTLGRKIIALTFLTAFFVGLLFLIFPPAVVFAPYFPPFIKEIWAKNVIELRPSIHDTTLFFLSSMPSVVSLLIGAAVFKFCPEKQRKILILISIPLLFLTGLSITAIRYARLSSLFTPFPLVMAFSLRADKQIRSTKTKGLFLVGIYVFFMVYLGINYISVNRSLTIYRRPPISIIKPYLPQGEGSILADTFIGPEIIWELDEKVIGAPYHRNVEGIADNFWMFYGENTDYTLFLLKKHRVKAIVIFLEIPGKPFLFYNMEQRYRFFSKATKKDSLVPQLLTGKNIPCGITEDLNSPPPFLIFNVDFSTCSDPKEEKALGVTKN